MKSLILSAVFVSAVLLNRSFAYNHDAKPGSTSTKEIVLTSGFEKIVAGADIHLVLVQDVNKSTATITGDDKSIEAVNITITKGFLTVTSKKNLKNRDVTIYIPVSKLTSLELRNDASVTTNGILIISDLKVLIHAGSKVDMKVIGNFQVEPVDDCDFVYEKFEKTRDVYIPQ